MGDPTTDKDSPGYSQNQRWQDQQAPDSGARSQQWEGYHLSDLSHSQRKVNNSHTAYISGSLPISMLCRGTHRPRADADPPFSNIGFWSMSGPAGRKPVLSAFHPDYLPKSALFNNARFTITHAFFALNKPQRQIKVWCQNHVVVLHCRSTLFKPAC